MSGRATSIHNPGRVVAALVAAVVLAGCSSSSGTPIVGTPISTPTATAPEVTPSPTDEATATPTVAPSPSPTATPTATPVPTSPAAGCTGSAENKAFFADATAKLHFDVYCAVLPSNWWLQTGSYQQSSGGFLQVDYKTAGAAAFSLWEGAWCPPTKACIAVGPLVGPASFGGLAGNLYLNTGTYTLRVGSAAHPAYEMVGSGMTEAQFKTLAAALIKVPKA